jgi:DNA-directed RNA polymerase specialized sigma24 family protein
MPEKAETLFTSDLYEEDQWQAEKVALKGCVQKLSSIDRSIIESHFVKCWKYAQIAETVNKTLSWVKVRMHRLRESLRNCVRTATMNP